jgi:ABC-type nitrate/sulfonate/bicarbonate transport system permease component
MRPAGGFLRGLLTLAAGAAAWELAARTVLTNRLVFVPLSTVGATLLALLASGTLWRHARISLLEFALGFALALAVGVGPGTVLGTSRPLREWLDPVLSALHATPIIALGPLFIVWLGLGIASKVAVVFLSAVFPVLISTAAGVATVERGLLEVGYAYGASRRRIVTSILFPAALPAIVTGVRVGVSRGVVAVAAAELFGARAGLGFLILEAGQTFDTATLFAAVLLLAAGGAALVELVKLLERRLAPWRYGVEAGSGSAVSRHEPTNRRRKK